MSSHHSAGPGGAGSFTAMVLLSLGAQQARAQHTETPIKVGGGAMTFYLDKLDGDWSPGLAQGKSNFYCAAFSAISATDPDVSSVTIKDFDHKDSQTLVAPGATSWSITLTTKGTHTVTMEGSMDECGPKTGFGVKITVHNAEFYQAELPANRHNRRFKDTGCVGTKDQDECERLDTVVLASDGVSHLCDDLDCRVLVGTAVAVNHPQKLHKKHHRRRTSS
jgi:hypothetical protein